MPSIWKAVLALPPRLAGMTPCLSTMKRMIVTPTSRMMMRIVTHHQQLAEDGQTDQRDAGQCLVCQRISDLAERCDQTLAPREVAIQPVGERREHEDDGGCNPGACVVPSSRT